MELKLKDNLHAGLTLKKEIVETVLSLMGPMINYTKADIEFYTMLGFVINIEKDNIVIELLNKETNIKTIVSESVEPFFNEVLKENEELKSFYNIILLDIEGYYHREVKNRRTVGGQINYLLESLGELTEDDIMTIISQVQKGIMDNLVKAKPDKKVKEETLTKETVEKDLENLKMKAMIEKFQRENITK